MSEHPRAAVAFSGGSDSMALLDLIYRYTKHRPAVCFSDTQMEYPESLPFVEETCARLGAELHVARAPHAPLEQWRRQGWPMLGKLAARTWQRTHKDAGFRCDVSSCCQKMKIDPARKLMRRQGVELQFTGQRGGQDDQLRGLRAIKDGALYFVKSARLHVCNPLLGWTDMMVRRYREQHGLPEHPARSRGAVTIGCVYCGGGAQFTNSGFRVLRRTWPEAWRRFIVEWRAGEIILAVKYDVSLDVSRAAVERLGGLETLAAERPWLFDYLRKTPLPGYSK